MTRMRNVLVAAVATVLALLVLPTSAMADDGQIEMSVPTQVPCYVSADGAVTTPSGWKIENRGSVAAGIASVSVTPNDENVSISGEFRTGSPSAYRSAFSYDNGSYNQTMTGICVDPGKSIYVGWTVGDLDPEKNQAALNGAANGGFVLAKVDFTFSEKHAFAVEFTDGEVWLCRRACTPAVGETFENGKTVAKVVEDIEDKASIFEDDTSVTSVRPGSTMSDRGVRPKTMEKWFKGCSNLEDAEFYNGVLDTSLVTSMASTFKGCSNLKLSCTSWNTSNVTDMSSMFEDSRVSSNADLSGWDTSNVTNMKSMFRNSRGSINPNVTNWNTSQVTDMQFMFYHSYFSSLDVSKWDTSQVTNMRYMFCYCSNLTSLDVSKWDTSSVTDMSDVFHGCEKIGTLEVSAWDTSQVVRTCSMFENCRKLTSLDLSQWDTSKIRNTASMFEGCSSLASLDVSGLVTSKNESMSYMFGSCSKLESLDLSSWEMNTRYCFNMFVGNNLHSLVLGEGWKVTLDGLGLPSTLYDENGTSYATKDAPVGIAATYYTKASYVPAQSTQSSGASSDEPVEAPDDLSSAGDDLAPAQDVPATMPTTDDSAALTAQEEIEAAA